MLHADSSRSPDPAEPEVRVVVDVVVLALTGERGAGNRAPVFLALERQRAPYAGAAALPGSRVAGDEDLHEAAARVLHELQLGTGSDDRPVRHLEQLATFGRPDRDPRKRTVSVTYLALLPEPVPVVAPAAWLPAVQPPPLAFDHADILATAVQRLRGKLSYSTVAYGLLPDEFTLSELQQVYEAVLGRWLDKRNFRKKVLALQVLAETSGQRRGPHRPAQLYRFSRHGLVVLDDVIAF